MRIYKYIHVHAMLWQLHRKKFKYLSSLLSSVESQMIAVRSLRHLGKSLNKKTIAINLDTVGHRGANHIKKHSNTVVPCQSLRSHQHQERMQQGCN